MLDSVLDVVSANVPVVTEAATSLATKTAVALYKLAHGVSNSVVGSIFGVPSGSVHKFCNQVWNCLYEHFVPIYLPPLTLDRLKYALVSFEKNELDAPPGLFGCIDGIHFHLTRIAGKSTDFWNWKHRRPTIGAQGIALPTLEFLDFVVGFPGCQNDAGNFLLSNVGRGIRSKEGPFRKIFKKLGHLTAIMKNKHERFRPFLFGDAGYPLLPSLITPYGGSNLSARQTEFNYRFSSIRSIIERAFGVLVMRWAILRLGMNFMPNRAGMIALICVALHNFCCREHLDSTRYLKSFKFYARAKRVRVFLGNHFHRYRSQKKGHIFRKKLHRWWISHNCKDF